jgi:hypothetical protein
VLHTGPPPRPLRPGLCYTQGRAQERPPISVPDLRPGQAPLVLGGHDVWLAVLHTGQPADGTVVLHTDCPARLGRSQIIADLTAMTRAFIPPAKVGADFTLPTAYPFKPQTPK